MIETITISFFISILSLPRAYKHSTAKTVLFCAILRDHQWLVMKSASLLSAPGDLPLISELAVLQRVKSASVTVDGQLVSTIGKGLLIFAGIAKEDTLKDVESMADKILKAKLWDDDKGGKWKCNVQDIDGEILCGRAWFFLICMTGLSDSDFSLAIHSACINQEEQTKLPQISAANACERAVRQILRRSSIAVQAREDQGRSFWRDDGRFVDQ